MKGAADSAVFIAFMQAEGMRYGRDITAEEIKFWFAEMSKVSIEDFKTLWQGWRDGQYGHLFPKVIDIQRQRDRNRRAQTFADPTCTVAVGGQRCRYPGSVSMSVHGGGKCKCGAHAALTAGPDWDARALAIIELSQNYASPKNDEELMERGAQMRAAQGARWRESHPELYAKSAAKRAPADRLHVEPSIASPHVPPPIFDEIPPADSEFSAPVEP